MATPTQQAAQKPALKPDCLAFRPYTPTVPEVILPFEPPKPRPKPAPKKETPKPPAKPEMKLVGVPRPMTVGDIMAMFCKLMDAGGELDEVCDKLGIPRVED